MFSGHSGVGKSTLVNTIEPTLNLKTKAISGINNRSAHTTFAEMFDLSFGANIWYQASRALGRGYGCC